jgi:hypothetical protein
VAVAALAAVASPAPARSPKRHHHRAAVRRGLIVALRRHPGLISNPRWLRQADVFGLQIPATLRLGRVTDAAGDQAPSDDTASLDFGSSAGGAHTLRLAGSLPVLLTFNDRFSVGFPGDINVSVPAGTGATPLITSSLPLEASASLSSPQPTGCGDFATTGGFGATSAGVDDPALLGDYSANVGSIYDVGPGPYDTQTSPASSNPEDVQIRTAPLALSVIGSGNGGVANMFGVAPSGAALVRLRINLGAPVSTLIRVAPSDPTYGGDFQCRELWSSTVAPCAGSAACGAVRNVFPLNLAGGIDMSPAITADGRLRLATLALSTPAGGAQPVTLSACLDPYSTFAAGNDAADPFYPAGPSTLSPYIDSSTGSPPPNAGCGAAAGPFDRPPFNLAPTGSSETLTGQLSVTRLTAELILG